MLSGAVTNRYTQGLFKFAEQQQAVDKVDESLKLLADVLGAHPKLQAILNHPLIDADSKANAITNVFGEALDPLVARFVKVLLNRGRGGYIAAIYERFHALAQAAKGELTVEVHSAMPLAEEQLQEIEKQLSASLNKKVRASLHVDPDLIAGCRIRVGDRVIDATIRGALAQFSQKLVSGATKEGTL